MTGQWRVGKPADRGLYRQSWDEPSEDDEFLGVMEAPNLAEVVAAMWNVTFPAVSRKESEPIPFIAVGNNEPIPDGLPEEIKAILREGRAKMGVHD